jgi:hypothetical protein
VFVVGGLGGVEECHSCYATVHLARRDDGVEQNGSSTSTLPAYQVELANANWIMVDTRYVSRQILPAGSCLLVLPLVQMQANGVRESGLGRAGST